MATMASWARLKPSLEPHMGLQRGRGPKHLDLLPLSFRHMNRLLDGNQNNQDSNWHWYEMLMSQEATTPTIHLYRDSDTGVSAPSHMSRLIMH